MASIADIDMVRFHDNMNFTLSSMGTLGLVFAVLYAVQKGSYLLMAL
ncbi:unnamed protein product [Acidithrix sp. C25]|nr:unnamed protein product [Acidithrix sp. C25]